ncbi:putative NACHT domain-containing protein [Seiridium cardinale]
MSSTTKGLVYRVRQLPESVENHTQAATLLSWALELEPSDIHVCSLATVSISAWSGKTKTATVMFDTLPQVIQDGPNEDQWLKSRHNLRDNLILDSHFRGMTPLYDIVPPHEHKYNCIAISGLASHPFGSWQPKGREKKFMWLRDALPRYEPTIRTWIYGYDTSLNDVTSFQLVSDLASALVGHLTGDEFTSSTAPSMMFLAHSLGGIVLKEAIGRLANSGKTFNHLLSLIKGAIMFGVPNLGMEQSHLRALVGHQPNRAFVDQLANGAEYLSALDQSFLGHRSNREFKVFWAYETRTSSIPERGENGEITISNSRSVLVSKSSATSNFVDIDPALTIAINKDHSGIVKYQEGDEDCEMVLSKIRVILNPTSIMPNVNQPKFMEATLPEAELGPSSSRMIASVKQNDEQVNTVMIVPGNMIISSLHMPELDQRIEDIEGRARHTFEWVFENTELEFTKWLRSGENFYWIRGKPGSGKSTLMKFIFNDERTLQQLNNYKQSYKTIFASFFFHNRGSLLQKSLEGLLRSILAQILTQQPKLTEVLDPLVKDLMELKSPMIRSALKKKFKAHKWSENSLWTALQLLLHQQRYKLTICLFLDALDEYNKTPEDIKDFLYDVLEESHSGSSNVKICFSSRPWESFTQSFETCPGFAVHNYTIQDIRSYCYQNIESHGESATEIAELVPDITETAHGVFLWARLALRDLVEATKHMRDLEGLRKILQGLPKELHDYYEEIVRRCDYSQKEKAYVLLEIVTRSDEPLTLQQALLTQACSDSTSFDMCRQIIESEDRKVFDTNYARMIIHNACGGLLEVRKFDDFSYVQLMHQTVREFVLDAKFKPIMLEGAKFRYENGYSFLNKSYLTQTALAIPLRQSDSTIIQHHLKEAEMTTGTSQFRFITSFAPYAVRLILRDSRISEVRNEHYGNFHLGLWANLQLYLEELTNTYFRSSEAKASVLHQFATTIGLSGFDHECRRCFFTVDEYEYLFSFLHTLGFEFAGVAQSFIRILIPEQHRSLNTASFLVETPGRTSSKFSLLFIRNESMNLVQGLLAQELDPVAATRSLVDLGDNALYICNPEFTRWLLDHQASPISVDQWGRTLVDYAILFFAREHYELGQFPYWPKLATSMFMVLRAGGRPKASEKRDLVKATLKLRLLRRRDLTEHESPVDGSLKLLDDVLGDIIDDIIDGDDEDVLFPSRTRTFLSSLREHQAASSNKRTAGLRRLVPKQREAPEDSEVEATSFRSRLRTRFSHTLKPPSKR